MPRDRLDVKLCKISALHFYWEGTEKEKAPQSKRLCKVLSGGCLVDVCVQYKIWSQPQQVVLSFNLTSGA